MFGFITQHGSRTGVESRVIRASLAAALFAAACTAHYPIHPGAINVTDSTAYDALMVAEAAIDQARLDLKAGRLPDQAKDPLNALINAYNIARESWLTYRDAMGANLSPQSYLDQMNKNLSDLAAAIRRLEEAK